MSLVDRLKTVAKMWRDTAPEGQYRMAYGLGEFGNAFQIPFGDSYQRNLDYAGAADVNTTVAACVQAYSWALSAVGIDHVKVHKNGEVERIEDSAVFRAMRYPSKYQTQVDFIQTIVTSLLLYGNAYAYVTRNQRTEITELHPINSRMQRAFMSSDGSELFYDLRDDWGKGWTFDPEAMYPARDVLHVKLHPTHSLLHGTSPIMHAATSASIGNRIQSGSKDFLGNMIRPSGILTTEQTLSAGQKEEFRIAMARQGNRENVGRAPILDKGVTWHQMTISAVDADIVNLYKMSVLDIIRTYRIPPAIVGLENIGAASGVESLINQWRATGLLFVAENIERALERIFELPADEELRFDLDGLARSPFAEKIGALTQAVQHGVMAPNEARKQVGLKSVKYGDDVRVQAQAVPLSQVEMANAAPSAPAAESASGASPASALNPDAGGENNEDPKNEEMSKDFALFMLKKIMNETVPHE